MKIEIDEGSGFCFGVTRAIGKAGEQLAINDELYCLGDIVHNGMEVKRLKDCGLIAIDHQQLKRLRDVKVLLRAHGEPPETYAAARENNIEIVDATCPVVLALQRSIRKQYEANPDAQIVIFGKSGHAEVLGLVGQTRNHAIVVEHLDDVSKLDLNRDIYLYSQTTKKIEEYQQIIKYIENHISKDAVFKSFDTICRQVANRIPHINAFASKHQLVIFVSDKKSSNGRVLFQECKRVNPNSYFIERPEDIQHSWIKNIATVGICGATSTPKWLMENCKNYILKLEKASSVEE